MLSSSINVLASLYPSSYCKMSYSDILHIARRGIPSLLKKNDYFKLGSLKWDVCHGSQALGADHFQAWAGGWLSGPGEALAEPISCTWRGGWLMGSSLPTHPLTPTVWPVMSRPAWAPATRDKEGLISFMSSARLSSPGNEGLCVGPGPTSTA